MQPPFLEGGIVGHGDTDVDVEALEDGTPNFTGEMALSKEMKCILRVHFAEWANWVVQPATLLEII